MDQSNSRKDKYGKLPVYFVFVHKYPYYKCSVCSCDSCTFNINYRFNFKPHRYLNTDCYPVFICKKEDYYVDKELDDCTQAEMMSLLLNYEIPDNLVYYFQRESFGFELSVSVRKDLESELISFDEYGDPVTIEGTEVVVDDFEFKKLVGSIVIDTIDFVFTFQREEFSIDASNFLLRQEIELEYSNIKDEGDSSKSVNERQLRFDVLEEEFSNYFEFNKRIEIREVNNLPDRLSWEISYNKDKILKCLDSNIRNKPSDIDEGKPKVKIK